MEIIREVVSSILILTHPPGIFNPLCNHYKMTDLRGGIFGQRLRGPWLRSVLVAVLVALCTALMPLRAIADDMAATLRLADERMRSLAKTTNDWRIHAGLKIYEARKAAYGDEDYSTAEKAYADAIKLLPPIAATERQRASLHKDRAAVLGLMGRTQEALKELDEV